MNFRLVELPYYYLATSTAVGGFAMKSREINILDWMEMFPDKS